ncbi:MAG: amidohydrolase family protein [Planctomycetota bacterium]|jgi:predicted TIM-barrel fold metal-dependent hydrolase
MKLPIIDIHNHPNWEGHNIDALVKNMDQYNIEKTGLLSWEIPEKEFGINQRNYEFMDPRGLSAPLWMVVEGLNKYPDRFIGGWAPDPRDKNVRAKLKSAVSLHGIKIYGELKCRMLYDSPDAIATFRYCSELGLPVLFHLQCGPDVLKTISSSPNNWPEWFGGDMTVVENMCRLCPETDFIGHGPGLWQAISGGAEDIEDIYPTGPVKPGGRLVEVMKKYNNLYCDLSADSGCNALRRDSNHAKSFLENFQDRILFGRDLFDDRHLHVLEQLNLSDEIMKKILRLNAEKLLQKTS